MATTPAAFKNRFPEFWGVDDGRVQLFLDDAASLMGNVGRWLTYYDVAQSYYAAHLLALSEYTADGDYGVVGPITKQDVEDVSIEQAVSPAKVGEDHLDATSYGKRYISYRRICFSYIVGV